MPRNVVRAAALVWQNQILIPCLIYGIILFGHYFEISQAQNLGNENVTLNGTDGEKFLKGRGRDGGGPVVNSHGVHE